MTRKIPSLVLGMTLASVLSFGVSTASADFPERNLTYINPFSPGGESDIVARLQQPLMEEHFGQGVTINYRTGGGGAVGWSHLKDQPADGYSMAAFSLPHIVTQPMVRSTGYETDDLKLVYTYHSTPQVLVVRQDSPYETLGDFLAAAEESPGAMTVGGTGEATGNHLAAVRLMKAADIDVTWIPFPGTGPTIPALLGGHVSALMTNSTAAYQNIDSFRALAVAWDERLSFLEDVPTFREEGYDVVEAIYRGVLVPSDTPDDVVAILAEGFDAVNHKIAEKQQGMGAFVHYWGPEQSAELVERLKREYAEILAEEG
ncbi:tripartite tricarboxylate transporter substrate binding protein [Halomonas alkalisoli]|uniref:tripartite tricarboxylate transporter substrate binding protein n=1 Tax=Halomonas alkalisoli TaxID=2907158 RepID=UPI001F199B7E|nr:tripartite tricarboxylate transporter substrate binding protein [Halomonas alkalisoli]MCE9684029.1 tripartite tricarboxylate transporter substrate binding protein [Halomonas alkalisoli]